MRLDFFHSFRPLTCGRMEAYFKNRARTEMKKSTLIGLAIWAFIPLFNAASLSSSIAFAVMAMIGSFLTSSLCRARIALVA